MAGLSTHLRRTARQADCELPAESEQDYFSL